MDHAWSRSTLEGADFTCRHLNASILWSKLVYQISIERVFVPGISIRFIALSSISSTDTRIYGRLGYLGRANTCPQKLRTTQMWRANINLFPVECNRVSGEFNRVWQLVVSQLVNGEVETTPVCSGCPVLSFLCFPSWCTDLRLSLRPLPSACVSCLPPLYFVSPFLTPM